MSGLKKLGSLAGRGAAGAAGRARWWGLRSPQWGQWVRRCAAPRQTQCSGLQGRAAYGSRWRTQKCPSCLMTSRTGSTYQISAQRILGISTQVWCKDLPYWSSQRNLSQ